MTSTYSDAAHERQRRLDAKKERGERILWSDLVGILEPNPDLPDCQARSAFSQPYLEAALVHNRDIARLLVELFETRFDPELFPVEDPDSDGPDATAERTAGSTSANSTRATTGRTVTSSSGGLR